MFYMKSTQLYKYSTEEICFSSCKCHQFLQYCSELMYSVIFNYWQYWTISWTKLIFGDNSVPTNMMTKKDQTNRSNLEYTPARQYLTLCSIIAKSKGQYKGLYNSLLRNKNIHGRQTGWSEYLTALSQNLAKPPEHPQSLPWTFSTNARNI